VHHIGVKLIDLLPHDHVSYHKAVLQPMSVEIAVPNFNHGLLIVTKAVCNIHQFRSNCLAHLVIMSCPLCSLSAQLGSCHAVMHTSVIHVSVFRTAGGGDGGGEVASCQFYVAMVGCQGQVIWKFFLACELHAKRLSCVNSVILQQCL